MGYDVHLTRSADWTASAEHPIREAELADLAATDASLAWRPPEVRHASNPATGARIAVQAPWTLVWTGHPAHAEVPLWYRQGRLSTKHPDEAVIGKMKEIAGRLGAVVVGDEGEVYA